MFINVFRQADHVTEPRARTLYTIVTAGKATFFTSFTTAAAFAANIASMVQYYCWPKYTVRAVCRNEEKL